MPRQTAKRSTKKRALSPEKSATEYDSDASVGPSNEKPAKRPRSSTIIPTEEAATSVTTTANAVEENENSIVVISSDSDTEDANKDTLMLGGKFDLYGMALPFLNKVYSPSGSTTVFPEKLYNEILTYQAKNDRTAKVTVPEGFSTGKDGQFRSGIFCDPMEEMPFDIVVTNIQQVNKLKVKSDYGRPADAWDGLGLKAEMEIDDGGCGIASSSGSISMHPLWRKVDEDGKVMELYEGTFTFKVTYSSLYSRKGHGRGQSQTISFWGIRAKV